MPALNSSDRETGESKLYLAERFTDDLPVGQVAGRSFGGEITRSTVDEEDVIGIDHHALRMQPLMEPGWGRAGIVYGPFRRESGLAFGLHVLNGHNTSQTGHLGQSLPRRFLRWATGSGTDHRAVGLLKLLWKGDKRRQWKQMRRWVRANRRHSWGDVPGLDENFAVGWFSAKRPADPVAEGNALVMHAVGPENGELWATVGQRPLPAVRGLQNTPFYYVVILREEGAAYYAAGLPGAFGVGSFPNMRPLAIDPDRTDPALYAAAWQSVQGQIGFWVDTRIYGARVAHLAEYRAWFGTAQAADRLQGEGDLNGTVAEIGGYWQVVRGRILRTLQGACAADPGSIAILKTPSPPGLIHVLVQGGKQGGAGLVWRWRDDGNYWQLQVTAGGCWLYYCCDGELTEVAADPEGVISAGQRHSLQLTEAGTTFATYLDGRLLFDRWFTDERLVGQGGAGISFSGPGTETCLHTFEAHPAELPLPAAMDFDPPWFPVADRHPAVADDFLGDASDLSGRLTPEGGQAWKRVLGRGRFSLTGDGWLQVQATLKEPNPGRTAYAIPWPEPDFADVRVRVSPPGSNRNEGQRGRGGIIFWQDKQNYLIVNTWLDDYYGGASLSSFFYLNGHEDIYDAVWTNVGGRITWGRPYNLRVIFDGIHYLVILNDEPVLYRALTDVYPECRPLLITRVGLVANWEWGNDTGSRFKDFQVFGASLMR